MNEQYYGVDLEYKTNYDFNTDTDNDITRALISYLKHNDVKVVKAMSPVCVYEGETYAMNAYKLSHGNSFEDSFEEILDKIVDSDARTVLIYVFVHSISYGSEMDENFEPVGNPSLNESHVIRMALIND